MHHCHQCIPSVLGHPLVQISSDPPTMPLICSRQILPHPALNILHIREGVLGRFLAGRESREADTEADVLDICFWHDFLGESGEHRWVDEEP